MDERHRVSRRHERETARKLGARQHAGSGSGSRSNDMHTKHFLIENKTVLSGKTQITLKLSDLNQLGYNAAIQGLFPALHFRIGGKNFLLISEETFALVDDAL